MRSKCLPSCSPRLNPAPSARSIPTSLQLLMRSSSGQFCPLHGASKCHLLCQLPGGMLFCQLVAAIASSGPVGVGKHLLTSWDVSCRASYQLMVTRQGSLFSGASCWAMQGLRNQLLSLSRGKPDKILEMKFGLEKEHRAAKQNQVLSEILLCL